MKSTDFLNVAIRLSNSSEEGDLRTSVSRCYYGAYHTAVEFLEGCGIKLPESSDCHEKVRWCMDQAGHVSALEASRELNSLRSDRNEADYDLRSQRFRRRQNVAMSVQAAKAAVIAIGCVTDEPEYSTIRNKIRSYARDVLKLSVSAQ